MRDYNNLKKNPDQAILDAMKKPEKTVATVESLEIPMAEPQSVKAEPAI
jgi:hypothetical protein